MSSPSPPRKPSFARRVAFALVPVVALLVVAELGLRLVPDEGGGTDVSDAAVTDLGHQGGGATLVDPDYGWRLVPGNAHRDSMRHAWARRFGLTIDDSARPDAINRHGHRDSELADPRPTGQRRLVVLGDSSVFGSGVGPAEPFSEQLQDLLDPDGAGSPDGGRSPDGRRVEIINTGVPGWSSYQSLQALRDALHLGLDGVIVYCMNSDMMAVESGLADVDWFPARRRLAGGDVFGRLATVAFLRRQLDRSGMRRELRQAAGGAKVRVPPHAYLENLREIVALADSQGIGGVFVVPATESSLAEDTGPVADDPLAGPGPLPDGPLPAGRSAYGAYMARVAAESGWALVDGPALFRAAVAADPGGFQGQDALFVDGLHPSVRGHALFARALEAPVQALLEATPPWEERAGRVKRFDPPSWLGQAHEAPAYEPAPVQADAGGLQELPCTGGTPGPGDAVLEIETEGLRQGEGYLLTLLEPGLQVDVERVAANCGGGSARMLVPAALGRVRVVGVVDDDHDGPCLRDRAAAVPAPVDLVAGEVHSLRLRFGDVAELGDLSPPYGLVQGTYPLLHAALHQRFAGPAYAARSAVTAVVLDPAVRGDATLADGIHRMGRVLEADGVGMGFVDPLDRPGVPLRSYELVVVVEPLGGGLAARAETALAADHERLHGWTDRQGRAWTLLAFDATGAERPDPVDDTELLPLGEGYQRAVAAGRPGLPPELVDDGG